MVTRPAVRSAVAPLAVAVAVLAVFLFTAPRHGLAWDEPTYAATAQCYRQGDFFPAFWRSHDRHPPLAKYLILAGQALPDGIDPLLQLRAGHLLAGALFTGLFFRALRRRVGPGSAFALAAMLVTTPAWFFHSQLATTDALLGQLFFLTGWAAAAAPPRARQPLLALLLALAFLTKYAAILVVPPLLTALCAAAPATVTPRRLLALAVLAGAIFLCLNLPAWGDPVARLAASVTALLDYRFTGNRVLFQGTVFAATAAPAWYLPVLLVSTTPLPLLAAWLFGLRPSADPLARFSLVAVAGTLLFFMAPGVPVYDGVREALWLFPCLFYLLAGGVARCPVRARALVLAILLAGNLAVLAGWFPHESSYYNPLVGGLAGAQAAGYEVALAGSDLTPGLRDRMNTLLPPGARVAAAPFNMRIFQWYQEHGLLRCDLDFISPARPAEYLVLQNRAAFFNAAMYAWRDHGIPLAATGRDGIILVGVYRLTP